MAFNRTNTDSSISLHKNTFSYDLFRFAKGVLFLVTFLLISCQKKLELKYGIGDIKQVVIANLYPGNKLQVNISKSKQPDDYTSIEFLSDCKVDVYENEVYMETLPFILKDTLSGLGAYVSSFNLKTNTIYKIISTHPALESVEASEYIPEIPTVEVSLLQHADSLILSKTGKYLVAIDDSANWKNYYFVAGFYRILKPVINTNGDTIYKYDYLYNIPSYTPEIPNPTNYNRLFTDDVSFDGQLKTFQFEFPSFYNSIYKEIDFIVEVANVGYNFYNWNVQQLKFETDYFNEGQAERTNLTGNIINGYGHFTANSSYFKSFKIK